MKDKRSKMAIRYDASKRLVMWHALARPLGLVLVTEFPKSGGTWFCQMLSDAGELPFPRNRTPRLRKCVMHGHHPYRKRFGRTIAVLRDGRDVMVSAYHHFLIGVDSSPGWLVQQYRTRIPMNDYNDVRGNMPEFIRFMFETSFQSHFRFTWSDFMRSLQNQPDICRVRYEDLLSDPVSQLQLSLKFMGLPVPATADLQSIVDKYSFRSQTNRNPGEESKNSFLRKGIAGDWKNVFSDEACIVFDQFAGNELIEAGYEVDDAWTRDRSGPADPRPATPREGENDS